MTVTALPGLPTTTYATLAAGAAAVTAAGAAVALRNRSAPGAGWLAAVLLVDAAVAAFAVGGHLLPRARGVALAVGGLGLLAAVPYVAFVVAYTGRGRHLTYWTLLGYGGPLFVAAALYATTRYHGLLLRGPVDVQRSAGLTLLTYGGFGPLAAPALLYVAVLLSGSLLLVVQTIVRHDRLYLGQSAALVAAAGAPLAAVLPAVGGVGPGGPRPVALASALMVVSTLALGHAAARHRLFEFVPAVRQLGDRAAVDDLDEGVLIVDDGDSVVTLNDAAAGVLDCDPAAVVGAPAADLFEPVGVTDLATTPTTFERATHTYEVTASPVTDERDRPIGRTFVLRDVTRRERRKQRLQVLNRVLRHNVRNDMSVVRTNASVVAEEGDDRLAPLGEKMVDIADELVEAGEKVRRTEQLLSAEALSTQTVDVEALLSSVVDEVVGAADATAVDATVAVAPGVETVPVNRELLELTLENVVENSVEHNGAAVPTVAVTTDRVADGVRVTVADDGPGIPAQELAALESGRETDLQHASSLGLWLVLWSVGRLEGDLSIAHLDPTGTAVSVTLPADDDGTESGVEDGAVAAESGVDDGARAAEHGADDGAVDPRAVALVADGVAEDGPTEGAAGSSSAGGDAAPDDGDPTRPSAGATDDGAPSSPGPSAGAPSRPTDAGPPRPPSSASAGRSEDAGDDDSGEDGAGDDAGDDGVGDDAGDDGVGDGAGDDDAGDDDGEEDGGEPDPVEREAGGDGRPGD